MEQSAQELKQRADKLGRMTFEEVGVAIILALTVVAWMATSHEYGHAAIAILAAVALFALGLLSWREVEEYVNWGIVPMYGGAIASAPRCSIGAAAYLARETLGGIGSAVIVLALLALGAELLGELPSHSAVVAALLPVGLGLAGHFGIDARAMSLVIAIPAGLTFILPVGTPETRSHIEAATCAPASCCCRER